jgi:uncharacterized protein (DUF488 family)/DNA-binding XRE family transcriptional regulator
MSRQELAMRAGVSANTLMAIEQGKTLDPGVLLVGRILSVMGASIDGVVQRCSPPAIVSIGYEGRDMKSFLDCLTSSNVDTVADVRLTPLSRKPGFSKRGLAASLAERGIAYRHYRALGNPKENRAAFRAGSDVARKTFDSLLDGVDAARAIDEIAQMARAGVVAVLCFEREHCQCHRKLVVDRLTRSSTTGLAIVP